MNNPYHNQFSRLLTTIKTKKIMLVILFVWALLIVYGCNKPSIPYVDNPYFKDTSKNDILEMYEQKAVYDNKLVAYYNDTYAHPANVQFREYQYLPGYEILPNVQMLDVETLKINHDIIDQRKLFKYSQMAYFLDNDALWYLLYINLDNCIENTLCYGRKAEDYLHYSMHEDQLFLHYRYETTYDVYEYRFYYFIDDANRLNVTLSRHDYNRSNQKLKVFNYVEYIENHYEKNFVKTGEYAMTIYDFETGVVYRKSLYLDNNYISQFYVPNTQTEYTFYMKDGQPAHYSQLVQYIHNQIKMSGYLNLTDITIGLNYIEGWNFLKPLGSSIYSSSGTLYLDDTPINDALVVTFDPETGNVTYVTDDSYPYEVVDEDLITLSRFGLSSGYTYASIEDLFNDGIDYDRLYQSRYAMRMSLHEVESLFESLMNP